MKLNMEETASVCSNMKLEAAATKTERVGSIVRWLQKRSHWHRDRTDTRSWVVVLWAMLIVALVMLGIAVFGFMLGTCTVAYEWKAWPIVVSKPLWVAKAWLVFAWGESATTQLVDVMAGVKMLSLDF